MERAGVSAVKTRTRTIEGSPPQSKLQEHSPPKTDPDQARGYSRTKLFLGLVQTVLFFSVTLVFLATGLSASLETAVRGFASNDYLAMIGFVLIFGFGSGVVGFPLKVYSGFYLEHAYGLSNQTLTRWFLEGLKGGLVSVTVTVPILVVLFWCLRNYGDVWWLPVGIALFFVSVLLARLAPVLLLPLFHKFKPLEENAFRERIVGLCGKVGMKISGVYVFDMSKNTKKANAAFTGVGKTRRIILADTLMANFTDEEIETVVAHELGHYRLHHMKVMLLTGTLSTFAGLYLTAAVYARSLGWFGFSGADAIAALPLLGMWLGVYSLLTTPLSNILSRAHERAADRFAVSLTGRKEAFSNALSKLAKVNLADESPHPLVEFLFHSHPSIARRIRLVEAMPAP